jgi:asparagine synthase (glutamine-hydrolysing)
MALAKLVLTVMAGDPALPQVCNIPLQFPILSSITTSESLMHIHRPKRGVEAAAEEWPVNVGDPPYIKLEMTGERPVLTGMERCQLGTPVHNPATRQEEGVFARWNWDGSRLTAQVDPLGFFSLFVWQNETTIILSPSILQLIAQGAASTPDTRALGVFYRLGLFINQDTPFREIKVLPPGGRLVWDAERKEITGGDIPPFEQSISRKNAVAGIINMPRASLRNILASSSGDLVLPLSGGRDSRHILLALDCLGARPRACVTYQQSRQGLNNETLAARAICERVGVEHRILGRARPGHHDILRSIVLTSLCSDEHSQMLPMHDYLRQTGFGAFDGIGGDILTNPDDAAAAHYARAQAGDFEGIARSMMQGHCEVISKPGYSGGPGDLFSPETDEEAVAYVAKTVEAYRDAPDPYQSFWFWHRTRREIGFVPSTMFSAGGAVYCPYLDTDFVRFCLSLPYEVTNDRQLHNEAIREGYPQFSDVPFGDSFAQEGTSWTSFGWKIRTALTGMSVVLAMQPKHPLVEIRDYLQGSDMLHRKPADIFQLYTLALSGMDADFARMLLSFAAHLRGRAPKAVVSDTYLPGIAL